MYRINSNSLKNICWHTVDRIEAVQIPETGSYFLSEITQLLCSINENKIILTPLKTLRFFVLFLLCSASFYVFHSIYSLCVVLLPKDNVHTSTLSITSHIRLSSPSSLSSLTLSPSAPLDSFFSCGSMSVCCEQL